MFVCWENSLNLSTKKMKTFYKRWLEFERDHGDAAKMQAVKERAQAYVASKLGGGDAGCDEDSE